RRGRRRGRTRIRRRLTRARRVGVRRGAVAVFLGIFAFPELATQPRRSRYVPEEKRTALVVRRRRRRAGVHAGGSRASCTGAFGITIGCHRLTSFLSNHNLNDY